MSYKPVVAAALSAQGGAEPAGYGRRGASSSYQLVAVGCDVVWKISDDVDDVDDVAVGLTRRPGQQVIAQLVGILAAYVDAYRDPVDA